MTSNLQVSLIGGSLSIGKLVVLGPGEYDYISAKLDGPHQAWAALHALARGDAAAISFWFTEHSTVRTADPLETTKPKGLGVPSLTIDDLEL